LGFRKKLIIIVSIIVAALSVGIGVWFFEGNYSPAASAKGKVLIMYAGSLVKTFESTIGSSFQKDSGYSYVGEGKGSVQLANMITDKQRDPDVFVSAGTIPVMKLMNQNPPLAHWLIKFASVK
jgi:molybdate/tungstate transport system substrate-binding protein